MSFQLLLASRSRSAYVASTPSGSLRKSDVPETTTRRPSSSQSMQKGYESTRTTTLFVFSRLTPMISRAPQSHNQRRPRCQRGDSGNARSVMKTRGSLARASGLELDKRFAAVLAVQHSDEGARCVLEAFRHRLAVADVAVHDPAREARDRFAEARCVVGHEEALHARTDDDQEAGMKRRLGALDVVLRHLPADRDPRADVQACMHCGGDLAAAVVEVHVDAVGARGLHCRAQVARLVVDRLVEAVQVAEVLLLVGAAGDPYRAAAHDARDLADYRADRSTRAGDHDGVARHRLCDVKQA